MGLAFPTRRAVMDTAPRQASVNFRNPCFLDKTPDPVRGLGSLPWPLGVVAFLCLKLLPLPAASPPA